MSTPQSPPITIEKDSSLPELEAPAPVSAPPVVARTHKNVYSAGQIVTFAGVDALVLTVAENADDETSPRYKYRVLWNPSLKFTAWANEAQLSPSSTTPQRFSQGGSAAPLPIFIKRTPDFLVQDNFYQDPDYIREVALAQQFSTGPKDYKGKRTSDRFLFPHLRERFEELLGVNITDWLQQPANGIFQITKYTDPLVWHSDCQTYAGAVYLNKDAPVSAGTSFWRDRKYGCRRPPGHPQELVRNPGETAQQSNAKNGEIYSEYNLLHGDNWELVDKVGSVYNRLVIWDGRLIHSASSYEAFVTSLEGGAEAGNSRLVQLFFFSAEPKE